jgi:hypothetical protein
MSLSWPDQWLCLYPTCVDENCIANLVAKCEGWRSLGRYRFRPTCEVSIKMSVKEILCGLYSSVSWKVPVKTIWPNVKKGCVVLVICCYTVIPRLTKIIRSGITFVSRNVISLPAVSNVNNPVGLVVLPYVMWSAYFFVTHIQTEKISSWNGPTVHVCCFVSARIHWNIL